MSDKENNATDAKKDGGKQLKSIRFNDAFNFSEANNSLGNKRNYNGKVQKWNQYAETLERYDTFAELLIDTEAYKQTTVEEDGTEFTYGIKLDPNFVHDSDDVILSHQKTSSHEFLKTLRGFGLLADIVGSGKTFEAGVVLSELAVRGFISSMLVIVPKDVYGSWVAVLEKCFGLGKCATDENGNLTQKADGEEATLVRLGKKPRGDLFNRANEEGFITPKVPMIVTMEDFVHWTAEDVQNKLFDVVVVDEAHNLNNGEGDKAHAMALLSKLMETKRNAKKTYCLLLSATPHSGNLEDMFRLWYFVRCKGGSPKDFDPKTKNKSDDYLKEREFYFMSICRNATTVRDFVRKEKIATVRGDFAEFCQAFYTYVSENYKTERGVGKTVKELSKEELPTAIDAFLSKHLKGKGYCDVEGIRRYLLKHADETVSSAVLEIRKAFKVFLAESAKTAAENKRLDYESFDYCYEGRKEEIINEFLDKEGNEAFRDEVRRTVASMYHNGVLRPIMIRQPDKKVKRTSKKRTVVNLMFFRTDEKPKTEITLDFSNRNGEMARVRLDTEKVDYLNDPKAIVRLDASGNPISKGVGRGTLEHSYVSYVSTMKNVTYGGFFKRFMGAFGHTDVNFETDEKSKKYPYRFHYEDSLDFYEEQMEDINREDKISKIHYNFLPVYDEDIEKIDRRIAAEGGKTDERSLEKGRAFYLKYEKLKDILRLHASERVIVFFDYLLGEEFDVSGDVYQMLLNDPEFQSRVLNFDEIDGLDEKEKTKLTDKFNDKSDAILVVKDKGLTEGTNFQACSVVVNFQITTDPLSMQQSIGRVFRIGQKNDVLIYSLAEAYKLEGYLLAYYSRIGLMSSDTGDAEILAGCNNDDMIALLCPNPECNHLVLKTKADCEQITLSELGGKLPEGDKKEYVVYCKECEGKRKKGQRYKMIQLITSDVKCDKCGKKVIRTEKEDGVPTYSCIKGEGTMATRLGTDGGKQEYYCDKYCAMSKCKRLNRLECKAVELYRMKNRQAPEIKAEACASCAYLDECKAKGCIFENGPDSVLKCRKCSESGCGVKPHVLAFNADWEAPCPACKTGTLKPEKTNSFSTYIQKLFQLGKLNKGGAFCERFKKTIDEVIEVKEILSTDEEKK